MPAQQTHADSIRLFHTGASALDATQIDPALSLGGKRSSSEVSSMNIAGSLSGVTVLFASGAHGQTTGTLAAITPDELSWTPAGASAGFPVTILHGQTMLLETAGIDGAQKFLRVRRDTSAALAGSATLTLSFMSNNAIGFEDVTPALASSGQDEYRLLCIRNVSSHIVKNLSIWLSPLGNKRSSDTAQLSSTGSGQISSSASLSDWPQFGFCHIRDAAGLTRELVYYSARTEHMLSVLATGRGMLGTSAATGNAADTIEPVPGVRIGKEAPASQPDGLFQTIAGPTTAPTGITWSLATDETSACSFGDLPATWMQGLWIHRQIPSGAVATPNIFQQIIRRFEAS